MQRFHENLFTGTAFTENQRRDIRGRQFLHRAADLQHLRAGSDESLQRGLALPGLQATVFLLDPVQPRTTPDGDAEQVRIDRLFVEIIGTHCDRAHRIGAVVVAGDHDDLGIRRQGQHLLQQAKTLADTTGIGRQAQVQRDHRGFESAQMGERGFAVFGDLDIEVLETPLQLALQTRVIFHDEELVFCFSHRLSIL